MNDRLSQIFGVRFAALVSRLDVLRCPVGRRDAESAAPIKS
jgi:hypothetical protein